MSSIGAIYKLKVNMQALGLSYRSMGDSGLPANEGSKEIGQDRFSTEGEAVAWGESTAEAMADAGLQVIEVRHWYYEPSEEFQQRIGRRLPSEWIACVRFN